MISQLFFFISEALVGIRRSAVMIFLSVATISVSLIVFGIFLLLSLNFNNILNTFTSKLEMRVYLKEDLTQAEIKKFRAKIASLPEITEIQFVDKDEAWASFKQHYKAVELEGLIKENPLPHSFKIKLETHKNIQDKVDYIAQFEDIVDEVSYLGAIAERLEVISRFVKILGLILVSLLTFATLLIIMNTIRLTIMARQEEIDIMKLVGATHPFIRWPFLIEGLMIGIIGSTLATTTLHFAYHLISANIQKNMPYIPIVVDGPMITGVNVAIVGLGICLGVFGAFISVSNSLKLTN